MQTVRYALHNAVRVFHRKNIMVVFVVLFLIPFLNIGVVSGYVGSIAVPEFMFPYSIFLLSHDCVSHTNDFHSSSIFLHFLVMDLV